MSNLTLKSLLVASKEVEVEFPGMPDFVIKLAFLSRETLQKLRKKATKTTYKKRQPVEELDDDLFLDLYVKATILGWSGLKLKYLEGLAPVEIAETDRELELEYSEADALGLMQSSVDFDNFISETATDLARFTKTSLAV